MEAAITNRLKKYSECKEKNSKKKTRLVLLLPFYTFSQSIIIVGMVFFSSELNRNIHLQIDMHYGNLIEHKWKIPYSRYLERSRAMHNA